MTTIRDVWREDSAVICNEAAEWWCTATTRWQNWPVLKLQKWTATMTDVFNLSNSVCVRGLPSCISLQLVKVNIVVYWNLQLYLEYMESFLWGFKKSQRGQKWEKETILHHLSFPGKLSAFVKFSFFSWVRVRGSIVHNRFKCGSTSCR